MGGAKTCAKVGGAKTCCEQKSTASASASHSGLPVECAAVGGGFAEITGDRVTILTDMAVKPEDIDEHAVEKALESAKQALLEKKAGPEAEALMALIQRSTAQLNLKRKRRTHS